MQKINNSFSKGMVADSFESLTQKDVYTFAANGKQITYAGNEFIMQAEDGNVSTGTGLPAEHYPCAVKVYNDIAYIISTGDGQVAVGSFPSADLGGVTSSSAGTYLNNTITLVTSYNFIIGRPIEIFVANIQSNFIPAFEELISVTYLKGQSPGTATVLGSGISVKYTPDSTEMSNLYIIVEFYTGPSIDITTSIISFEPQPLQNIYRPFLNLTEFVPVYPTTFVQDNFSILDPSGSFTFYNYLGVATGTLSIGDQITVNLLGGYSNLSTVLYLKRHAGLGPDNIGYAPGSIIQFGTSKFGTRTTFPLTDTINLSSTTVGLVLADIDYNPSTKTFNPNKLHLLSGGYTNLVPFIGENLAPSGSNVKRSWDIELQESFDNSINVIWADGVNPTRLVNSRFKVKNNLIEVADRTGTSDSNIYQPLNLDKQIELTKTYSGIPEITDFSVIDGGQLPSGFYTVYFKYATQDLDTTNVIEVTSQIAVFKGSGYTMTGEPKSAGKSITVSLANLDTNYRFLKVFYSYNAAATGAVATPQLFELTNLFSFSGTTSTITINGFEPTLVADNSLVNIESYSLVPKTITQVKNRLFEANINNSFNNNETLALLAREITINLETTRIGQAPNVTDWEGNIKANPNAYELHRSVNGLYYKTGLHGGETYRFEIVFIKTNKELTPAFPISGRDDADPLYFGQLYSALPLPTEANDYFNTTGGYNYHGIYRPPLVTGLNDDELYTVKFNIPTTTVDKLPSDIEGFFFVMADRIPNKILQGRTFPTLRIPTVSPTDYFLTDNPNEMAISPLAGIADADSQASFYPLVNLYIPTEGSDSTGDSIKQQNGGSTVVETAQGIFLGYDEALLPRSTEWTSFKKLALYSPDLVCNPGYFSDLLKNTEIVAKRLHYYNDLGININGDKLYGQTPDGNGTVPGPTNERHAFFSKLNSSTNYGVLAGYYFYDTMLGIVESFTTPLVLGNRANSISSNSQSTSTSLQNTSFTAKAAYVTREATAPNLGRFSSSMYRPDNEGSLLVVNSTWKSVARASFDNYIGLTSTTNLTDFLFPFAAKLHNFSTTVNLYPEGGHWSTAIVKSIHLNLSNLAFTAITPRISVAKWKAKAPALSNMLRHYGGDCYKMISASRVFAGTQSHPEDSTATLTVPSNNTALGYYPNNAALVYMLCESDRHPGFMYEEERFIEETIIYGNKRPVFPATTENPQQRSLLLAQSEAYNDGATNPKSVKFQTGYDSTIPALSDNYRNRVHFSELNVPGQFNNGYRVFNTLNFFDYPSDIGPITAIRNINGYLAIVCTSGIIMTGVNEQSAISNNSGGSVYIGSPDILGQNFSYLSRHLGSKWIGSVIPSRNYIYFVDTITSKVVRFSSQGVQVLSDFKVAKYITEMSSKYSNDTNNKEVLSFFDNVNNRVYFIFTDKTVGTQQYSTIIDGQTFTTAFLPNSPDQLSISYNESTEQWGTAHEFIAAALFYLNGKTYTFPVDGTSIYEHNKQALFEYYEQPAAFEIEFVAADNPTLHKIFNNLILVGNDKLPEFIVFHNDEEPTVLLQTISDMKTNGRLYGNTHRKEGSTYIVLQKEGNLRIIDTYANQPFTKQFIKRIRDKYTKIRVIYKRGEKPTLLAAITDYTPSY